MRLKRTYYEIMGVARNATAPEIKVKYHELARQFHPDRAKDKELAQRLFSQINMAYKTLSNVAERARYDETLDAEESSAARMYPGGRPPLASRPARPDVARPAVAAAAPRAAQERVRPTPAGSSAARPAPTAPTVARPTPTSPLVDESRSAPTVHAQPPQGNTLGRFLEMAHDAYGRGDLTQAMKICRQILAAAPDNFDALRLCGDIHSDSFSNAEALAAYKKALKVQPGNFTMQDKVRRLQAVSVDIALNGQEASTTSEDESTPTLSKGAKPRKKVNIFRRMIGGAG